MCVCVVKGRGARGHQGRVFASFPVGPGPGPDSQHPVQHPLTPPSEHRLSSSAVSHLLSTLQKVRTGETTTPPFVSGVFDILFTLLTSHFPRLRVAWVGGVISRPGHLYNRSYYNSASLKRSPAVDCSNHLGYYVFLVNDDMDASVSVGLCGFDGARAHIGG